MGYEKRGTQSAQCMRKVRKAFTNFPPFRKLGLQYNYFELENPDCQLLTDNRFSSRTLRMLRVLCAPLTFLEHRLQ